MTTHTLPALLPWREWTQGWPEGPETPPSWPIEGCSAEFSAAWTRSLAVVNALFHDGPPVSLGEVRSWSRRFQDWATAASTEAMLTFPPTVGAFQNALAALCHEEADTPASQSRLILVAQLRPTDLAETLKTMPLDDLAPDWRLIKERLAPPVPTPEPKATNRSSVEKAAAPVPPRHQATAQWLRGLLAETSDPAVPLAIHREVWDGALKTAIATHKGVGEQAVHYWFEDTAIPGLCQLDATELQRVLEVWPPHSKMGWNTPQTAVQSLWRHVRNMDKLSRPVFLQQVLPALLDTDVWTFEDRRAMLAPMLEKTKGLGFLFEERLSLWIALGGDLDLPGPMPGVSDNAWQNPMQSAREWILAQDNPIWKDELDKSFPARPTRSRHP